jgi:type I restriction enzyme S subunit
MVTSGSRGWAEFYSETGATFVRSQDINTDKLVLTDVAHVIPPKSAEGLRTRLLMDDLLVTITGANVAKAARVDVQLPEAYVSQHVALIRLALPRMSQYIHLYAVAPTAGRRTLLIVAYGAGKPGLNLDNLRTLPIPLPPLAEQEAIVEAVEAQLSVIDHLETDIAAKLKSAQGLRQSILRHAFTGQLVPQDPNEEPADELLKRIATEREERARTAASARKQAKAAGKEQVVAPKVRRKTTEKIRQKASI